MFTSNVGRKRMILERIRWPKKGKGPILASSGGAIAGGWLGSGMGIAASGTAIAATGPLAILGAFLGWLGFGYFKRRRARLEQLGQIITLTKRDDTADLATLRTRMAQVHEIAFDLSSSSRL